MKKMVMMMMEVQLNQLEKNNIFKNSFIIILLCCYFYICFFIIQQNKQTQINKCNNLKNKIYQINK